MLGGLPCTPLAQFGGGPAHPGWHGRPSGPDLTVSACRVA